MNDPGRIDGDPILLASKDSANFSQRQELSEWRNWRRGPLCSVAQCTRLSPIRDRRDLRASIEPQRWRAERFYRDLERGQVSVRVGFEATGHAGWFERLLAELQFELWIGDPAEIKAARVAFLNSDIRCAPTRVLDECYLAVSGLAMTRIPSSLSSLGSL